MIKSGSATILSSAARLVGELEADEEIILAGTFTGTLRTTRTVQVASTGSVTGAIHAESVLVLGRVEGPIHATNRIELQAGAVVTGDIEAQSVRIHDAVVFNGCCRISGPETVRRQYLLPAVVQAFGTPPDPATLAGVGRATEGFLRDFGFEPEVRQDQADAGGRMLRPIYRSREALPYAHLRDRLRFLEAALQSATAPEAGRERRFGRPPRRGAEESAEPLQTTGADAARALVEALGMLSNVAVLVGPVIVTRLEDERGPRVTVRVRQDSLPSEGLAAVGSPDPSAVLLSLQKVQTEVVRDLVGSAAVRAQRARP